MKATVRRTTLTLAMLLALGITALAHAAPASEDATTPARWEIGAVLDVRAPSDDGLAVLAITPGGAAERLGLRTGDRLVAINGTRFDSAAEPAASLRQSLAAADGALQVDVLRDGQALQVSGQADAVPTAAGGAAGCGYVSTVGVPPRVSEKVHPAEITRIDGRSTPLFDVNRHRVEAGRHVLTVRELIDDHVFNSTQLTQRSLMKRRELARAYKALVVDVPANTLLRVGARWIPEKRENQDFRDNAYWEPVVWEAVPQSCR